LNQPACYCTVNIVVPLTPSRDAFMVEVPDATLLATPNGLTVTTPGLDELQAAWVVMLIEDPLLKEPVAVIPTDVPRAMESFTGVIAMDVRVALLTVSVAVPTCPANAAEIVVVPGVTPVATPGLGAALLIVAMEETEDVQVAANVKS
jgi:hypothetical protein